MPQNFEIAYVFALCANLCFALGSQVFTYFSRSISSAWINHLKALVATLCFFLVVVFLDQRAIISPSSFMLFFVSGFIGLGVGDLFLVRGFSILGPGRTLVLFGFQPLVVGLYSAILIGQSVSSTQLLGIFFFLLCLITFSLERMKEKGSWGLNGLLVALIGMFLDATGVVISRVSFEQEPLISAFEANLYRCFGAILFFAILSYKINLKTIRTFFDLNFKLKSLALFGSFLGTFLSLSFYLKAIQTAHLATLTALSMTGAIFSSIFECIIEKKKPSLYLCVSFVFFLIGMGIVSGVLKPFK